MGTIFGLLAILFLIIYPPFMYIKWSIYGDSFVFPDFKKIDEKVNENSHFKTDLTGLWGKFQYYFGFLWTFGELFVILYSGYRLAH